MTPESRHHHIEHEDSTTDRFMKAVATATEGGKTIGDCKLKLHPSGKLIVATLHRIYPRRFSVYAQDTRTETHPIIMGLSFDATINTPGRNKLQKDVNMNPYHVPLDDRIVRDLEVEALQAKEVNFEDTPDPDPKDASDDYLSRLLRDRPEPPPVDNDTFFEELWERVGFIDDMIKEGLNDPIPENVHKVSEALEIVTGTGLWRRRKRLLRTESLLRKGLELPNDSE